MLSIDGSFGEGGGAILRTAVALSAVTGQPCSITNIRKGRPKPGIQPQHLEAINAAGLMCSARVEGNFVGSTSLFFEPQKIERRQLTIKIPTAGSIGLVLQSMLIAATRSGASIRFEGGATNGRWAMPVNYAKHVLAPLLEKMGYSVDIGIERYGYFPKGGAVVFARAEKAELKPIVLEEKGRLKSISGISHASHHLKNAKVAERQAEEAKQVLAAAGCPADIGAVYSDAACPGSALEIFAEFEKSILGADALGERGVKAEDIGKQAAKALLQEINSSACVDEHAEDQLLAYMALAAGKGPSRIRAPKVTSHTKTNIWLIEQFLPVKFEVDEHTKIITVTSR